MRYGFPCNLTWDLTRNLTWCWLTVVYWCAFKASSLQKICAQTFL